jgi:uncharacterized protein YcbX
MPELLLPKVSRIVIYPIKSVAGIVVQSARIAPGGSLERDREFALFSMKGVILRAKENPKLQTVKAVYDLERGTVTLEDSGATSQRSTYHLVDERVSIEQWFGNCLNQPVQLRRNTEKGFPDDRESPGPTVISAATFGEVASWFRGLDRNETARRFRVNLEIEGVPPFWEDRLYSEPGVTVPFRVGDVQFNGVNPCARCAVPPRHPETADTLPGFQRTFVEKRRSTLPAWASTSRFDHYYRLTVNTRIPATEAGKLISVGDRVDLLGS